MSLVVRPAAPEDYAAYQRLFPELGVDDPVPSAERWAATLMPSTLVASLDDRVAGYIYLQRFGAVGYVRNVVTAPEHRRQGLGRALMLAARAQLLEAGALEWCLNVKPDNTAARALYASLGLEPAHVSKVWRLPWTALWAWTGPAPAAPAVVRLLEPGEDGRFEASLGLLPGQLADARRLPGRRILGAECAETLVAALVFDPEFPGCFPFRVAQVEQLPTVLRALLPYRRVEDPWVQLVVEGQPAVSLALEAHQAELRLEILNLRGSL